MDVKGIDFRNLAVQVSGVWVASSPSHGTEYVLKNVNLRLPYSSIYALIGPSGCGKTTLIQSILKMKPPRKGIIRVFGCDINSSNSRIPGPCVSYMPQDVCLPKKLTANEVLTYFGKLYGLSDSKLIERIKHLKNLLELPLESLIPNLSGGEQRRVSLAVSLIHEPSLLLLDEPTVGLDPLLTHSVWSLLRKLCTEKGISIIISTHYIEEARKADVVGFMREGRILLEENPSKLLKRYKKSTLDEVFAVLCTTKEELLPANDPYEAQITICSEAEYTQQYQKPSPKGLHCQQFKGLIEKHFKEFIREPGALISAYILQLLVVSFICLFYGQSPFDLNAGFVVEKSLSDYSQNLNITVFDSTTEYTVDYANDYEPDLKIDLTQMFLQCLDSRILKLTQYTELASAKADLRKDILYVVFHFEPSFAESYLDRLNVYDVANSTVEASKIRIFINNRDTIVANSLLYAIADGFEKFQRSLSQLLSRPAINLPIQITPIYGNRLEADFFGLRTYITPAFAIFLVYSLSYSLTSLTTVMEINDKVYLRIQSAGIHRAQVFFARMTAFSACLLPSAISMALYLKHVEDVIFNCSLFYVITLFVAQILAGTSQGIFTALVFRKLTLNTLVLIVLSSYCFTGCGIIFPFEYVPYYLRWMNQLFPFAMAQESIRTLVTREDADFVTWLLPGYLGPLMWAVVFAFSSISIS